MSSVSRLNNLLWNFENSYLFFVVLYLLNIIKTNGVLKLNKFHLMKSVLTDRASYFSRWYDAITYQSMYDLKQNFIVILIYVEHLEIIIENERHLLLITIVKYHCMIHKLFWHDYRVFRWICSILYTCNVPLVLGEENGLKMHTTRFIVHFFLLFCLKNPFE